jgi:single-strand DNA-binding protein
MNKIIITGRITQDLEIKVANSGAELMNFSVAVDRRKKKDGERESDFFQCLAFGKTASFIKQYWNKGDGITIEGRMESHKFEKDGQKRTAWNLIVDSVEFPLGKSRGSSDGSYAPGAAPGGFRDMGETGGELPF